MGDAAGSGSQLSKWSDCRIRQFAWTVEKDTPIRSNSKQTTVLTQDCIETVRTERKQ